LDGPNEEDEDALDDEDDQGDDDNDNGDEDDDGVKQNFRFQST